MGLLKTLFGSKTPASSQQAVLVYLDAENLPAEVYEECDLSTIGELLTAAIAKGKLGEFDGDGVGDGEAVLFMYGPDAERLLAGIEGTLRGYPLCSGARVVIRSGPPGSPEREVRL
jgi:hypothetical protein